MVAMLVVGCGVPGLGCDVRGLRCEELRGLTVAPVPAGPLLAQRCRLKPLVGPRARGHIHTQSVMCRCAALVVVPIPTDTVLTFFAFSSHYFSRLVGRSHDHAPFARAW